MTAPGESAWTPENGAWGIRKGNDFVPWSPRRERFCSLGPKKGSKTSPRSPKTPEKGAASSSQKARSQETAPRGYFRLPQPLQQVSSSEGQFSRGRKPWGKAEIVPKSAPPVPAARPESPDPALDLPPPIAGKPQIGPRSAPASPQRTPAAYRLSVKRRNATNKKHQTWGSGSGKVKPDTRKSSSADVLRGIKRQASARRIPWGRGPR